LFSKIISLLPLYTLFDIFLIRPPKHSPELQIPVPTTKPFVGTHWEFPRFKENIPTKPLDIVPFSITCKQVKSQLRHIEVLQEPIFCSDEGK
jgi:hypothetical protein